MAAAAGKWQAGLDPLSKTFTFIGLAFSFSSAPAFSFEA